MAAIATILEILTVLNINVVPITPTKLRFNLTFVREKTSFGEFQDCGHLRYRNGMVPCCCLTSNFSSIRLMVLEKISEIVKLTTCHIIIV